MNRYLKWRRLFAFLMVFTILAGNIGLPYKEIYAQEAAQDESDSAEDTLDLEIPEIEQEKEEIVIDAEEAGNIEEDNEDSEHLEIPVEEPLDEGTSEDDYVEEDAEEAGEIEEEIEENDEWAEAIEAFQDIIDDHDIIALLYGKETFDIKESPSVEAAVIKNVRIGYQVKLLGVEIADNQVWYQVELAENNIIYQGYIENENLITSDLEFREWKEMYGIDFIKMSRRTAKATGSILSSFPESYQSYLQKLMNAHPNWIFIPFDTGLDWETVISNEMYPKRNLVPMNSIDSFKSTASQFYDKTTGSWYPQDSGNWAQASEGAVRYYMDPRNFLNEESVFQFELLTYSTNYVENGVEAILKNTFMSKKVLEDNSAKGKTYGKVLMDLGNDQKVSPYFLASRLRQEQGVNGTELISGKYKGYEGLYNYYNIGATGNTMKEVIVNGLKEAKKAGWTNRSISLDGGTEKVSEKYIKRGQDTLYLQKFDVDGSYDGLYWHQYMQNLLAADSEGKSVKKAYTTLGVVDNSFVFRVPIYHNMPKNASAKPKAGFTKPVQPVISSAKSNAYTQGILKWKKVNGITGYKVYRKTGANGTYKNIKTIKNQDTVTYTDKTLLPNRKYYYKVRAYHTADGKTTHSSYSKEVLVNTSMKAVKLSSVKTKGKKTAIVKWKKSSSTTGYVIYRKTNTGNYKKIKTIKGVNTVSYKNTGLKSKQTYYYKVRAYKTVGGKKYYGPYSNQMKIVAK